MLYGEFDLENMMQRRDLMRSVSPAGDVYSNTERVGILWFDYIYEHKYFMNEWETGIHFVKVNIFRHYFNVVCYVGFLVLEKKRFLYFE